MLPSLFERSLEFNSFYKYNRTSKFFNHFKAKVNFSETNKLISDIFEKLNLSANKAEKDIGIYKSSISKMEQAKELIEELRIKDKKKD